MHCLHCIRTQPRRTPRYLHIRWDDGTSIDVCCTYRHVLKIFSRASRFGKTANGIPEKTVVETRRDVDSEIMCVGVDRSVNISDNLDIGLRVKIDIDITIIASPISIFVSISVSISEFILDDQI